RFTPARVVILRNDVSAKPRSENSSSAALRMLLTVSFCALGFRLPITAGTPAAYKNKCLKHTFKTSQRQAQSMADKPPATLLIRYTPAGQAQTEVTAAFCHRNRFTTVKARHTLTPTV